MSKKFLIIIVFVLVIIVISLSIKNKNLNSDNQVLENQIQEIQSSAEESEDNALTSEVYLEAEENAEKFIISYFQYEDLPDEEIVSEFISNNVSNKLNFGDELGMDDIANVSTEVNNLEIFYGSRAENKQQIYAKFDSIMDIDGSVSEAPSFLKLDMIKENDNWVVNDLDFVQY